MIGVYLGDRAPHTTFCIAMAWSTVFGHLLSSNKELETVFTAPSRHPRFLKPSYPTLPGVSSQSYGLRLSR